MSREAHVRFCEGLGVKFPRPTRRCHHTLDTAFAEDDHPWIEADEQGMLAVLLLRRIAYTLLALFRAVTLRSDDHRAMRWKALLAWVRDTLVAASAEHLAGLRPREVDAVTL